MRFGRFLISLIMEKEVTFNLTSFTPNVKLVTFSSEDVHNEVYFILRSYLSIYVRNLKVMLQIQESHNNNIIMFVV